MDGGRDGRYRAPGKRTAYLATLANVATLLGLLGTIVGLIAAFTAVASAEPAEKASMPSGSISVAMNTTAFGLISAIPLLLLHAVLQTCTTELVDSFEMAQRESAEHLSDLDVLPTAAAPVKARRCDACASGATASGTGHHRVHEPDDRGADSAAGHGVHPYHRGRGLLPRRPRWPPRRMSTNESGGDPRRRPAGGFSARRGPQAHP